MAGVDNPLPGEFAVFFEHGRGQVRKVRSATDKTLLVDPLPHEPARRQIAGARLRRDVSFVAYLPDRDAALRLVGLLQSAHGEYARRKRVAADWYSKRKAEILRAAGA